jgi:hypothetical protein
MDAETAKWILGAAIAIIGFFLKSLHTKVDNAVSKMELSLVISELKKDHEQDRKELRENQINIFQQLQIQQQLLTQVATKVEMLVSREHNQ